MCGIAGIYIPSEGNTTIDEIKAMTDRMPHRGPDGEGQWINSSAKIGFGHRRLSILDLSEAGKQPMHFLQRYTITFNGEIYNYVELRDELIKKGFAFHTGTDTEVLLVMFHVYRERCLQQLDGMFAFAIWDEIKQELFCARDRFGEKPFHYYWDQKRFVFASEIKALFAGGVVQQISQSKLQDFLDQYLIERKTETFFEGVHKLAHSHYLTIRDGKLKIKQYYDIKLNEKAAKQSDEGYADRFRELFVNSIKRRQRSDVPVGSSLSGGLDSSSIVCFMREQLGHEALQKTFSARFEGHVNDEGKWMKLIAGYAHTEHHEVHPDIEVIREDIARMIYHHEYPIGSSSQCAWWYVMKSARDNDIKVLLDGQGADEYLSGYPILKNFLLMEHLFHFRFRKFFKARKGYRQIYGEQYPLGKMLWAHPILYLIRHPKSVFHNGISFKQRLKHETMNRLQELLAYADRTSMAHSIEVRLPFLSHELVDYCFSLPNEQLYHDGVTKYVLRNAIKGHVPDELVTRYDKIGYDPPQDLWERILINVQEVEAYLLQHGYKPGPSRWRNYIATVFHKAYTKGAEA